MSGNSTEGRVYFERHDHILKIVIDNPAKKNAFSPEMMAQLSDAYTLLDKDNDLWVGVLCANGDNFTAGLDMPKFFGPTATSKPRPEGNIDPFGLANQCRKPIVTAVTGIVFTVGIEMMLAGDIVVAADNSRFCQMEAKRGIAPLGGAHFRFITRAGWGDAMYHLMLCDEFTSAEAYRIGLVQEVVPAGQQNERAMELARMISRNAPLGIQVTKEAGRKFIEAGEQAAIAVVPKIRERVMNSDDAKEGIQSFVEAEPRSLSDDELWLKARQGGRFEAQARRRTARALGLVDPAARDKPDHAFRQPMPCKLRAHAVMCEHLPISGGAGAPHLYEFPLMGTWLPRACATARPQLAKADTAFQAASVGSTD